MIRAAATEVDITPEKIVGTRLAGFSPNRKSKGLLHPLKAGLLYLTDGETEVCLASLDSIGYPAPLVQRIRDKLQNYPDPMSFLPCSTHSHATPDTIGIWGTYLLWVLPIKSGIETEYILSVENKLVKAADELKASGGIPVKFKITEFDTDPDWIENIRKGGIVFHKGIVMQVIDEHDKPVSTLINFAAHPECLWDKNKYISPDYVHFVRQEVDSEGQGVPIYFSGALGGMVTIKGADIAKSQNERLMLCERAGKGIASCALEKVKSVSPIEIDKLSFVRKTIYIPVTATMFKIAYALNIIQRDMLNNEIRTEVNLIKMGPLHIATAPGEVLPEVGKKITDDMNGDFNMLFALGCDELGYILDPDMFANKEYKYEKSMSCGKETATIIHQAISSLENK